MSSEKVTLKRKPFEEKTNILQNTPVKPKSKVQRVKSSIKKTPKAKIYDIEKIEAIQQQEADEEEGDEIMPSVPIILIQVSQKHYNQIKENHPPDDDIPEPNLDDQIFTHLKQQESLLLPNTDSITSKNPSLSWNDRNNVIHWLIEIQHKYQFLPETLLLATNVVDRYLSERTVERLELLAMASFFIAAKFEENNSVPSIDTFMYICDNLVERQEDLIRAERVVLYQIGFRLCWVSPLQFLRFYPDETTLTREVAKYFMDIACTDHRFIGVLSSKLASAALYLARVMMYQEEEDWWGPDHVSQGYQPEALKEVAIDLLDCLDESDCEGIVFRKFACKEHLKVSLFVQEWMDVCYLNHPVFIKLF